MQDSNQLKFNTKLSPDKDQKNSGRVKLGPCGNVKSLN